MPITEITSDSTSYSSLLKENLFLKNEIENIIRFISHGYMLGEIIETEGSRGKIIILNHNKQFAEILKCEFENLEGKNISNCFPKTNLKIIEKLIKQLDKNSHCQIEESFIELNKYIGINAFRLTDTKFIAFFEDKTANIKNHLEIVKSNVEKAKYKEELLEQYKSLDKLNIKLNEKVLELNKKNNEIITTNNKLAKSQLKVKMAIQAASLGIWEWDIANDSITFDETAVKLLNIPKEFQNRVSFELFEEHIHSEDLNGLRQITAEYLTGEGKEFKTTFRIRPFQCKNNVWYIFQSFGKATEYSEENFPIRMTGTYIDITMQKKAETEVLETRKFLELILDNTPSGIFTVNNEKKITNWNKRAEKILGYTADEVIGYKCSLFASKKCEDSCELFDMSIKKPIINKECVIKNKAGKIKYLKKNMNVITGSEGKVIGGVESFEDVTEIKNMEKKILQAIIETEEKERRHISKELHDGLGSMISSIKLHMNMIQSKNISPEKRESIIAKTNLIINETSQNVRNIANYLRPSTLSDFGLIEATETFCKKVNNSEVLKVKFEYKNINELNINHSIETNIYRIIQELINNTLKHANADNTTISLSCENGILTLDYKDDGIGIGLGKKVVPAPEGHGIKNIISRCVSIGADYVIGNNSTKGMFALITYKIHQDE